MLQSVSVKIAPRRELLRCAGTHEMPDFESSETRIRWVDEWSADGGLKHLHVHSAVLTNLANRTNAEVCMAYQYYFSFYQRLK